MNCLENFLNILYANKEVVTPLISLIAVFVSFVSVSLSAYIALLQRKHYRNSMRPIARFDLGDYEDHIYVRLNNVGIGPLFVLKFQATSKADSTVASSLIEMMPGIDTWENFTGDITTRVLRPGEYFDLISIRGDSDNPIFDISKQLIRESLRDIEVSVTYNDIYGVEAPPCTRLLDWFGRHLN